MKTCTHCGAENDELSMFCSKCWGELKSDSAPASQEPQPHEMTQTISRGQPQVLPTLPEHDSSVFDAGIQPGYGTQPASQQLQKPSDIASPNTPAPQKKVENVRDLVDVLRAQVDEEVKRAQQSQQTKTTAGAGGGSGAGTQAVSADRQAKSYARDIFAGNTVGFGDRFKAYLCDMVILFVLGVFANIFIRRSYGMAFGANFLVLVGQAFYHVFFIGALGQTPGKMFMGIRVVNEDGTTGAIGYERAFLRWLGYTINTALFCIGWLMVAMDARHQGIHDKIARTVVVWDKR